MELQFYLNHLVNVIINTYFNDSRCLYILTDNLINFEYIGTIPVIKINIAEEDFNFENILTFGCQEFVVRVENATNAFESIEANINNVIQRFNDRKYLLISSENVHESDAMVLFNSSAIKYVTNLVLIVNEFNETYTENASLLDFSHENDYIFKLYTHKYVGLTGNNDPVLLDKWFSENNSFSFNGNLFPDKITDQQGKTLTYTTFTYPPYSIVGSSFYLSDGTEWKFAFEYAMQHNCTVEFVVDQEALWGEIYDNKTGIGVLGNLVEDRADLGYVALYTWYHEFNYLDLSASIIRTGITCLTPSPRRVSGWLVAFFPFSTTMWIAVFGGFILSIASFYYVTKYSLRLQNKANPKKHAGKNDIRDQKMLQNIIMHIFGLYVLQGLSDDRLKVGEAIRMLLTSLLIFCLLLSCSYGSGLASSMTIPRFEAAIDTVNDLSESGINWAATHEAWIFSILEDVRPNIVKIKNKFQIKSEEELERMSHERSTAFAVERLPGGHFAIGEYIKEDNVQYLLLMREDIYWEQCVFMSRKSSVLMPSLNKLFLRILSTGLPAFWESQVSLKFQNQKVQLEVTLSSLHHGLSDSDEPVVLKLEHVNGIFMLWLFGILFSIIAFFIELAAFKYKTNSDLL